MSRKFFRSYFTRQGKKKFSIIFATRSLWFSIGLVDKFKPVPICSRSHHRLHIATCNDWSLQLIVKPHQTLMKIKQKIFCMVLYTGMATKFDICKMCVAMKLSLSWNTLLHFYRISREFQTIFALKRSERFVLNISYHKIYRLWRK